MSINLSITGSSGFVGSNFIKSTPNDFNITEIDLLAQKIEELNFENIDSVLHLAALVHQMKGAPEEKYFKINRDLAYDVAKKAKSMGVKHFVFMSTVKVFGESTTGKPAWNENSECNPLDPYGKSKFEAERLILGLEDEDFKISIIRSPLVYGVGVRANMLNLIKLTDRIPFLPLGGIKNKRSMVYIGNLVALLNHVIRAQVSGIFIACDRSSLSTTGIIHLISKSLGKKRYLLKTSGLYWLLSKMKPTIADRLFGSLEVDSTGTNKLLGFLPPYTIEFGINEMVKWYLKDIK